MKIIRKFGDRNFDLDFLKSSQTIDIEGFSVFQNRIILMEQIHSGSIKLIAKDDLEINRISRPIAAVDGLITAERGIFLAVKTADCVPVFLWDDRKSVIAALHSGRLGTEQNIAGKAVKYLVNDFGCRRADIKAELGPAICGKCYPVDEKTFKNFVVETEVEQNFPNLDLKKVIVRQLLAGGILPANINDRKVCTKEDEKYFSYRQDQSVKRQISVIGCAY